MDLEKTNKASNTKIFLSLSQNKTKSLTFSNREFDILACLLNNMQTKKIASYLSVSPSTVETHIRNLITKIGCGSRKEIIAFIEQSEHSLLVKKHSKDLLIKIAFEQELKEFVKTSAQINCTIFYYKTTLGKNSLISQVANHLTLAGISVSCKGWSKRNAVSFIGNDKDPKEVVIYCLDNTSLEKIARDPSSLIKEIAEFKEKQEIQPIILFLSEQPLVKSIKDAFAEYKILTLSEQKNYYLLIFELLKLLVPSYNFTKTLEALHTKHDIYNYILPSPSKPNKQSFFNKNKFGLKKYLLLGVSILFLLAILILGINNLIYSSVKKIHSQHVNTLKEKTAIINLPPRNFSFTGRKKNLMKIRDYLNKYNFGTITQAISGLGGVGKTQLALEFAYQSAESNTYSAILWITAETENAMYNSYKEIANALHVKVDGLSLGDIQSILHNKLTIEYKNTNILIVLDNVPSYNEIKSYLTVINKELAPFLVPNILITSRSQQWPELPLILDNFTPKEALTFVKKHLPNEPVKSINKLTETLNYFPLALGQAVSYIKNHTNINDYLELYKFKQKAYLDQFPTNNQYNETLWKTWNISLYKLSKESRELLFISAYLAPDNIPIIFFENLSTEKRAQAIAELRKYSLVTMINNKAFKIHRLLQEVIRLSINFNSKVNANMATAQNLLKTNSYWLNKTMDLLNAKFDYDFLHSEKWKSWSKYLSHVQVVSLNAIENSGSTLLQGLKLYIKHAMFLVYIQRDGSRTVDAWNKILELTQAHTKSKTNELLIANIKSHLSNAVSWTGDHGKAKEILESILPSYQNPILNFSKDKDVKELLDLLRVIPFKNNLDEKIKKNCDLNFTLLILGATQYYLGLVDDALTTCLEATKVFESQEIEKLDNISQYYLVDAWADLGCVYIYLGQYVKAERILNEAILWLDKLFTNHPRQARTYAEQALLMYHLGKFKEGKVLLNKCSKIRELSYSPQHQQQADTQIKLGFINITLGKINSAKQNFRRAEKIYKIYNDGDLVRIFVNLGFWKIYESTGKHKLAKNYMDTTIKMAKLQFKNKTSTMMSSQLTQAETWAQTIVHTDLPYWQHALEVNQQLFGNDHYQTAKYHYILGLTLSNIHKKQEAFNHYNQALYILSSQKIRHPNLKKFYVSNIKRIQLKLKDLK